MDDIPRDSSKDNTVVPIWGYDRELAVETWEQFQKACLEEAAARAKRIAAHKRFMAAFMGGAV